MYKDIDYAKALGIMVGLRSEKLNSLSEFFWIHFLNSIHEDEGWVPDFFLVEPKGSQENGPIVEVKFGNANIFLPEPLSSFTKEGLRFLIQQKIPHGTSSHQLWRDEEMVNLLTNEDVLEFMACLFKLPFPEHGFTESTKFGGQLEKLAESEFRTLSEEHAA